MANLAPAIVALLAIVAVALAWLLIEARRLNEALEPVLGSSIVTGLSSI